MRSRASTRSVGAVSPGLWWRPPWYWPRTATSRDFGFENGHGARARASVRQYYARRGVLAVAAADREEIDRINI